MRIQNINNTNFNGYIKSTPTFENLFKTADFKVKLKLWDIDSAMSIKKDHLAYSFANSKGKKNGEDVFHIALLEEDTRNSGYKIAKGVMEIPGKYENIEQVCEKNKNLLKQFYDFFEHKYSKEFESLIFRSDCIDEFHED